MNRPVKAFDTILNSVVMELQRSPGAKITLTLEIEAEAPSGFNDADVDVVRDNTKQLLPPDIALPVEWQAKTVTGTLLGQEATDQLRDAFKACRMLSVRAPLSITPRASAPIRSHVDLFLKAASPGERAQTLVVRGAITVPTEGKRATLLETHAALEGLRRCNQSPSGRR